MAEEIVISNANKIRVGKLIRIYQKEKGITLFDLVENVCSRQIATNFNKGIPAKNDDSYLGTLAKLGFSYNYKHDMDSFILLQSKRLKDAVEWYDTKCMKEICTETIQRLEPYSKYIIEYEYLRAFGAIYKFHFVNIKIEEETNHFLETIDYLNRDIVELLKNIMFKYCYKYYGLIEGSRYYKKFNIVYKQLNLANSLYTLNRLNYAVYLLSLKYHFDCFKILIEVEAEYTKTNNYNGLLLIYIRMFWLIGNIQEKSLDNYEEKFNKLIKSVEGIIDKDLIMQGFINLAISHFELKHYEKAKVYFLETLSYEKSYVKSAICLMFLANSKKISDINVEFKPTKECIMITDREKMFYQYYLYKNMGYEYIFLLDYLDEKVIPYIYSNNSFYYMVFERELKCLQSSITPRNVNCRRKLIRIIEKFRRIQ